MHIQRTSVFSFFLLFTFSGIYSVQGQSAAVVDSTFLTTDSLSAFHYHRESKTGVDHFHYGSIVPPAAMIAYGVISLQSNGLKNLNTSVKEEVWARHPHKLNHLDNYLQFTPLAAVYGLNIAGVKGVHNFRDRTIIYGISAVVLRVVVPVIKKNSGELRPDGSDHYSFPSGHTATAFAAAEFMRREYKDVSLWYGAGGYAAAALTGYLRLYNNKHWLGDVVAGAGVGILSTDFAYFVYPRIKKLLSGKKTSSTFIMPTYQSRNIGLCAVRMF